MFFGDWVGLLRTLAVGIPVYLLLILMLRLAGKRALAKLNAYGLVVTVALGSTLATTFLSKDVELAEGIVAMGLLLLLQFAIAWIVLRFPALFTLVTNKPRLLLYRGELLADELRSERMAREEIEAAVRSRGHMSLSDLHAIVLETDGSLSVIAAEADDSSAMQSVANYPPERR